MDTSKRHAADRIRPILAAMERSIDSARRRRLHLNDDTPQQTAGPLDAPIDQLQQQPAPIDKRDELIAVPVRHQQPSKQDQAEKTSDDDSQTPGKARLKARPKRPVGFSSNPDRPFYGAKAG